MAWAGYRMARDWPRSRQLALGLLFVLIVVATWKGGMTRPNVPLAFGALGIAMIPFFSPTIPRSTAAVMLAMAVLVFVAVPPANRACCRNVRTSVSHFVSGAADAFLPWRWDGATARTRADQAADFGVPPHLVDELAGRTVHIDPWQAAVDTAYPVFTWTPLPVFQSFSAYTPYLDELNAEALRSAERPEGTCAASPCPSPTECAARLARRTAASTGSSRRRPRSSASAAIGSSPPKANWQVLADTGTQCCGRWQPLGEVTARLGQPVPVPRRRPRVTWSSSGAGRHARPAAAAARHRPVGAEVVGGPRRRPIPACRGDGRRWPRPGGARTSPGSPTFAFGPPCGRSRSPARAAARCTSRTSSSPCPWPRPDPASRTGRSRTRQSWRRDWQRVAALVRPAVDLDRDRVARVPRPAMPCGPCRPAPTRSRQAADLAAGPCRARARRASPCAGTSWVVRRWLAQVLLAAGHAIRRLELLSVLRAALVVSATGLMVATALDGAPRRGPPRSSRSSGSRSPPRRWP